MESLSAWTANNDLTLLQDPKGNFTFHSGRWKSETNPDLAFARTKKSSRPSLITASHRITTTSKPVKRWNFCKANWKRYGTITNNLAKKLPLPDARNANIAYQAFCSMTINAAKQGVPRGKRKLCLKIIGEDGNCKPCTLISNAIRRRLKS